MKSSLRKLAIVSLFLVYLVISAGAIVRMTGSGMGCPDWPKCFGYYIPPVERAALEWQPSKEYKKGQVIILEEALWVADSDFISGIEYDEANWSKYTKHDYAEFNAFHTWTEFINRLLGALAGLAVFIMALVSLSHWKKNRTVVIIAWVTVLAMGFQAWLGATVVYSVLEPVKISLHMIMALAIVGLLLYVIYKSNPEQPAYKYQRLTSNLIVLSLILTLIQIAMGIQVRQFIDDQINLLGEQAKDLWLAQPELNFYIHRSFSTLVFILNGFLAYNIYKNGLGLSKIYWVMLLILAEVLTGIAMYYIDFPFGSQPLHLLLASLLFGVQFYLLLESRPRHKTS